MILVEFVPTYEYECPRCPRVFEVRQRITEPALTRCDRCGGPIRRLLSAAPFILKGEGWHVTDYPSESRKKAMGGDAAGPAPPAPDSKTPEGKGEGKAESGAEGKAPAPSPKGGKSTEPKPSKSKSPISKSSDPKSSTPAAPSSGSGSPSGGSSPGGAKSA